MSNPHNPNQYRVNGVVRNVAAWYQPQERVHIW